MLDVLEFYADYDYKDPFGSLKDRENPHRGSDILAEAGALVPAWRAGTVAGVGRSSIIGDYVVVRDAFGQHEGYAHLVGIQVKTGDVVQVGSSLGKVAGHDDYHGSAWTGPHLHTTYGPAASSVYTGKVYDPWPEISKELATLASLGTTPISEEEMKPYIINDGKAYYLLVPGRKGIWLPDTDTLTAVRKVLAGDGLGNLADVKRVEAIWSQIPV